MEFWRQELGRVDLPSPGDLHDPGTGPRSPALHSNFTVWALREAQKHFSWFLWVYSVTSFMLDFRTLFTETCQGPPSMRFSRKEYCSGLSCPFPGNFPYPCVRTCISYIFYMDQKFFTYWTPWEVCIEVVLHSSESCAPESKPSSCHSLVNNRISKCLALCYGTQFRSACSHVPECTFGSYSSWDPEFWDYYGNRLAQHCKP